jgi:hypothetical protein
LSEERVELPSGEWAVLRDPKRVLNEEREAILERVETDAADSASFMTKLGFADRLVVLMVKEWSYPLPVPSVSPESLKKVFGVDIDQLRLEMMKPARVPFLDIKDDSDPKAPTGNSETSKWESPTGTSNSETISRDTSAITA